MKIKDKITEKHWGCFVKTKSKKFGTSWYYIIKYPAKSFFDKTCFARISDGAVMFWNSMKEDEVLQLSDTYEIIHKI